ncbi:MAG: guanylate kinase, partial [Burkholderiaceae bacterium]|nr:guanylate kinase [Burkholderiaceae bacterium]
AGEFLEWAKVHGNSYATSRRWIDEQVGAGDDILLEIDWQGAMQVREAFPDTVGIFIAPPSIESLRERLTRRGQDSAAVIEQRVAAAKSELREAGRFEHVIINQEFAIALHQLEAIVEAARTRYEQQRARNPALFAALGVGTNR